MLRPSSSTSGGQSAGSVGSDWSEGAGGLVAGSVSRFGSDEEVAEVEGLSDVLTDFIMASQAAELVQVRHGLPSLSSTMPAGRFCRGSSVAFWS